MASYTPNYRLKKPSLNSNEYYRLNDMNDNWDIIDTQLKTIQDSIDTKINNAITNTLNSSYGNIT